MQAVAALIFATVRLVNSLQGTVFKQTEKGSSKTGSACDRLFYGFKWSLANLIACEQVVCAIPACHTAKSVAAAGLLFCAPSQLLSSNQRKKVFTVVVFVDTRGPHLCQATPEARHVVGPTGCLLEL